MNKRLAEIHNACLFQNIPFVSWQLPGEGLSTTIIASEVEAFANPDLKSLKGFVVAPFTFFADKKVWHFPPDFRFREDDFNLNILKSLPFRKAKQPERNVVNETSFEEYKKQFHHLMELFRKGKLQKAVLSRVKTSREINAGNVASLFQQAGIDHPHAMVYMFNIPEKGVWMGVTPETLLRKENNQFLTQSVAGTRYREHFIPWTEKEVTEQSMVTRFIQKKLEDHKILNYSMNGPENYTAGSLIHLKTDFIIAEEEMQVVFDEMITELHPTPAVCGLPKEKAFKEILKVENHERGFYSGFMGFSNNAEKVDLFVNLRCMQVFDDYAALYAGGGLTIDSVLEAEWEETEKKSQTLLNLVSKL